MSDSDDYDVMYDGTDAEWFAASGNCGGCGFRVADGKRYERGARNNLGYEIRFCECAPAECGCGPHPQPNWLIPGEQALLPIWAVS